jgi:hypothetical protein
MVARRIDDDHGKTAFLSLEANVGSVEMKPERRIKSEGSVPRKNQEQLIERGGSRRERLTIEEFLPAMDDTADSIDGKLGRTGAMSIIGRACRR